MAEPQFRTIAGVVQFDPREGDIKTKDGAVSVRNVTVRATGVKEQSMRVGATLWPSHDHIEVNKGDFVVLEGKFTRNTGEKDGEAVTYNNLSVSSILNLGSLDEGVRDSDEPRAKKPEPATDEGDDGIPF